MAPKESTDARRGRGWAGAVGYTDPVEQIQELIKRYGLGEDQEYVIIPLPAENGRARRCFLLKRRFIRIVYPEGNYIDYPLTEAIEATVRYPDILLSEALYLLHKDASPAPDGGTENKMETNDSHG